MLRSLLFLAATTALAADSDYTLGPDSQPRDVPRGELRQMPPFTTSQVLPGTTRDWWLYIPAQYDAAKPACVMVFFDGGGYVKADGASRVPVVFDNLIAKKEMPVTIGVFITPGTYKASLPGAKDRSNRSFE
jgi:enterochelin esterase family protein